MPKIRRKKSSLSLAQSKSKKAQNTKQPKEYNMLEAFHTTILIIISEQTLQTANVFFRFKTTEDPGWFPEEHHQWSTHRGGLSRNV